MPSIKNFTTTNKGAALYVESMLQSLSGDSQLTMIITPGISEDCCVITATYGLSEDIEKSLEPIFSSVPTNTSPENTQDGSFPKK